MDEVKDMGNIIKTEFLKLKRYSVIKAGIKMCIRDSAKANQADCKAGGA